MYTEIDEIIRGASSLVSPPDVWIRLNEVVSQPRSTARDVADVIMRDPALTAKVLRIVNSPMYHLRSSIDTVSRAVTALGTNELFALATAVASVDVFSGMRSNYVNIDAFWKHSVGTALMARRLAKESCVLRPERLYVAGLLHDVGCLLLYLVCPDKSEQALQRARGDEAKLFVEERRLFGFDHAVLGAELLKLWNLPASLVAAVGSHHCPEEAGESRFDAALINLANHCANRNLLCLFAERTLTTATEVDPGALEVTGLTPEVLDKLGADLGSELAVALSIFMSPGSGASPGQAPNTP